MLEQAGLKTLRLLDPERAHGFALKALAMGLAGRASGPDYPILATEALGRRLRSPIGIAPGFDKHCEAVAQTWALGPGFTEIGGVAPKPQPGNPKPRLFRLTADQGVINRFGFNSQGHAVVAERLRQYRHRGGDGVIGVNLAINKDTPDPAEDYALGIAAFGHFADFLTVNVSSPNTKGLRDLQGEEALANLLARAVAARDAIAAAPEVTRPPALLVKVAPDLDEAGIAAVADVVLSFKDKGLAGLVISNTTIARPPGLKSAEAAEAGGLSGQPLFEPSTAVLKAFASRMQGRMLLVGAGGVSNGAQAYAKIKAGATLVQLYSALVYGGPSLIRQITDELATLAAKDGLTSISEAIGQDL